MIDPVMNFLHAIYPMHEPLEDAVRIELIEKDLKKGEALLRDGQVCKHVFFITRGMLRAYVINEEGKEVIVWYMMEMDVVVAVDSFFSQLRSEQFIEALEDTKIVGISRESLDKLVEKFPEFMRHRIALLEKYYAQAERRVISMLKDSADEKFSRLMQDKPHWINRLQDYQLAAYLGMDASTFSRAKGRYFGN